MFPVLRGVLAAFGLRGAAAHLLAALVVGALPDVARGQDRVAMAYLGVRGARVAINHPHVAGHFPAAGVAFGIQAPINSWNPDVPVEVQLEGTGLAGPTPRPYRDLEGVDVPPLLLAFARGGIVIDPVASGGPYFGLGASGGGGYRFADRAADVFFDVRLGGRVFRRPDLTGFVVDFGTEVQLDPAQPGSFAIPVLVYVHFGGGLAY